MQLLEDPSLLRPVRQHTQETGERNTETEKPTLGSEILAYIAANGPCKTSRLRDKCHAPATEIKAACDALTMSGNLTPLKSGHLYIWALPEQVNQIGLRIAFALETGNDAEKSIRCVASNAAGRKIAGAVFRALVDSGEIQLEEQA